MSVTLSSTLIAPEAAGLLASVDGFHRRSPTRLLKSEYRRLLRRPIRSVAELESFIRDYESLREGLDAKTARLYALKDAHVDNEAIQRRFKRFSEQVLPDFLTLQAAIEQKYRDCPFRERLPQDRYALYDRKMVSSARITTPRSGEFVCEEQRLLDEYASLMSSLTIRFHGRVWSYSDFKKAFLNASRAYRKEAWEARGVAFAEVEPRLSEIFDELVAMRQAQARDVGFRNYINYFNCYRQRYDFTPFDCKTLQNRVEKYIVPLASAIWERKCRLFDLDSIRPWDLSVYARRQQITPPHRSPKQLLDQTEGIFQKIHPQFGDDFRQMRDMKEFDIRRRPGKADVNECFDFPDTRRPFILTNPPGRYDDIIWLVHESGHGLNIIAARDEELYSYRQVPALFAEVPSTAMEMIALDHAGSLFSSRDYRKVRRLYFQRLVLDIPDFALADAWQHWVYANPGAGIERRNEKFCELDARFNPGINWDGVEEFRHGAALRDDHNFSMPLYDIEYIVAALAALQILQNYRENPVAAIRMLRKAMSLGGSVSPRQLFREAGIALSFSDRTFGRATEFLARELDL